MVFWFSPFLPHHLTPPPKNGFWGAQTDTTNLLIVLKHVYIGHWRYPESLNTFKIFDPNPLVAWSWSASMEYYTYGYIPAYRDLLFYGSPDNQTARHHFFHFVKPTGFQVKIDNVFFSDDITTQAGTFTQATYGFDSSYICKAFPQKLSGIL